MRYGWPFTWQSWWRRYSARLTRLYWLFRAVRLLFCQQLSHARQLLLNFDSIQLVAWRPPDRRTAIARRLSGTLLEAGPNIDPRDHRDTEQQQDEAQFIHIHHP